jgi:hypothetical protein
MGSSYRAEAARVQVQRAVKWASGTLELSAQEVGHAFGASQRTVVRWIDAANYPSNKHIQAAERILVLAFALQEVFGNDMKRLHSWLHEPLPAFRGRTPLRMILDGGIEEVITVVANVDGGVFA